MKFSKGQGISFFTAIITFGILTTVVFLAPLTHTITFWLGYFFALFALVLMSSILLLYFAKPVKEEKFLSLPAVKVTWTYFVLQTTLSVWEMVAFPLPYLAVLIINLCMSAIFSVIILALYALSSRIDNAEGYTAEKVIFIKQIKSRLDSIETNDQDLAQRIKEIAEDVRFSDPMSHSRLASIEDTIFGVVDELAESVNDLEKAYSLCNQAAKLLKTRNEQCKIYKGVRDNVAAEAQKNGNGNGVAIAGIAITLALFIITLAVCFIIIPQNKYDAATELLLSEKYDEATSAFLELGNFRDSEEKVEEIKTILLDKQYDVATAFQKDEKYDEAIATFTELGNYRDSKDKIEEIKTILLDKKYAEAEKCFNDGKYSDALKIYKELNGYKDSKGKIEEINNRMATGNKIYFGTYNNEPIAWQIVKTDDNKILLLADKTIKNLPINSELKTIAFKDSTLNAWLNMDFVLDFTDEQKDKIIETNGVKVFLLDEDLATELKKAKVNLTSDADYWISTKSEKGFKFITKSGQVDKNGDLVVRDKGIRPAIWISID